MTKLAKTEERRQKNKRFVVVIAVLALALLLFGLPLARAVQKALYPLRYAEQVEHWAAEYDVDPYLVYAIIKTESSFQPNAESSAGARGLMQMTDETFEWIKLKIAPDENLTFADMYQPQQSIRFGVYFFSISLEKYGGDISTAAAAYHSGWGTVDRLLEEGEYTENGVYLSSFPHRQMNHYVHKINRNYEQYKKIYTS